MIRLSLPRTAFVPAGALKVSCKLSGAVAYVFSSAKGRPAAMAFTARAQRPVFHQFFATPAAREKAVRDFLANQRAKIEARKQRQATPAAFVVGDLLSSSWGYDQTNVDFYEVVKVAGAWVTVRKVAQVAEQTGHDMGRCAPQSGDFVGEPIRRLAQGQGIRINSYAWASKWNTDTVAGVPVGPAVTWTTGH